MATVVGQRTTLSDTVGLDVDMSPVIQLMDPFDVGLISYIGMNSLEKPATETEHKWREDTLRPILTLTTEALDTSETGIDITSGEYVLFRAGDLIMVDDEVMRVASVAADTITVETRGTRSTAAAHDSGATVYLIGSAITEGSTSPRSAISTQQTTVSNYTQIFEDVVEVTSSMMAVEQYSPGSEYARQLSKTMKTLMILMNKAAWYGYAKNSSATGTDRSFNGVLSYLRASTQPSAQKVDASSAQLYEKLVLDLLLSTYDYGGVVNAFFLTLTQKIALGKFLDANRRVGLDETTAGAVVDRYLWDQGVVDTVIDRWLPKSYFVALDTEYIGMGPLGNQTLGHEILPKLSRLAQKGQITGEYTMEFKSPKSSGYIKNLATSIV